ncbi:MAG: hypothetical protein GX565_04345 [Lentisphaerae bacterium]|nr:hypothetical protein [Lentisphaerota bacterium]
MKRASAPVQWLNKARSLRRSADVVWEEFNKRLFSAKDAGTGKFSAEKAEAAIDIHFNSLLLYSLSAECALKRLIIKNDPSSVLFKTTMNGSGELIDAEITKLGSTSFDTHNLERLAEIVGMLKPGDRPELRELLAFCTHCKETIRTILSSSSPSQIPLRAMSCPSSVFMQSNGISISLP